LSILTQGSSWICFATSSWARVNSFSFLRSSLRASSHSSRDTVLWVNGVISSCEGQNRQRNEDAVPTIAGNWSSWVKLWRRRVVGGAQSQKKSCLYACPSLRPCMGPEGLCKGGIRAANRTASACIARPNFIRDIGDWSAKSEADSPVSDPGSLSQRKQEPRMSEQ